MKDIDNPKAEYQTCFWDEYSEYIKVTPMSAYERRLLRKWVSDGHSVYEDPGSKYLCDPYPPRFFLDAYREDRAVTIAIRGMSEEQKTAYLKSYMGYTE